MSEDAPRSPLRLGGPGVGLLSQKHSSSLAKTTAPHGIQPPAPQALRVPKGMLHCSALFCVDVDAD